LSKAGKKPDDKGWVGHFVDRGIFLIAAFFLKKTFSRVMVTINLVSLGYVYRKFDSA
jgi:hypothetical protein